MSDAAVAGVDGTARQVFIRQMVRDDVASAEASGARGTPTFFIGDRRHTGPHDTESLAAALEASRDGSGAPRR